jgi:quercetin dioxygenase-like cupin family protein
MLDTTTDHGLWFMTGRIHFHVSKHDNADGLTIVEHTLAEGFGPPLHIHRDEDEFFHVIAGEFRFRLGDKTLAGLPGDVIALPRGIPHGFRVLSPEGGRCLTITRGSFEDMLRAASRRADHAGLPEQLPPTARQQAALFDICAANGIDLIGPPID